MNQTIINNILNAQTYYDVLLIPKGADYSEINENFQRLGSLVNPDDFSDPESSKAFKLIVEAYKTLSDPKRRLEYDESIHFNSPLSSQSFHRFSRSPSPQNASKISPPTYKRKFSFWVMIKTIFRVTLVLYLVCLIKFLFNEDFHLDDIKAHIGILMGVLIIEAIFLLVYICTAGLIIFSEGFPWSLFLFDYDGYQKFLLQEEMQWKKQSLNKKSNN